MTDLKKIRALLEIEKKRLLEELDQLNAEAFLQRKGAREVLLANGRKKPPKALNWKNVSRWRNG